MVTSDFKFTSANETVTASAGTLAIGDVLADGSTTDSDVLNATLTGAAGAVSLTNIETVNLDVRSAGGMSLTSVSGTKNLNINSNEGIAVALAGVSTATAPVISLKGNGTLTTTITSLTGTTAAGTGESLSVKFDGAVGSAANPAARLAIIGTAGATGTLETLNIESVGTAKNTVDLSVDGALATGISKSVVTGAADLELRGTAALFNGQTLDASAHTGALTVRADFDDVAGLGALTGLNAEKFAGVDGYVVIDSNAAGVSADAFGLYNIATGSTVRIADDFLLAGTSSIITVAGAAAGSAESVSVNLNTRSTTPTDVDLTGLTINGVETITINSAGAATSGANIQNSITTLLADKVQTLILTGSSELSIGGLAAGTSNSSNITVDASALTAKLAFTTGVIADTTATGRALKITGGTADDTLDASAAADAVKVTYTGGTGKDTFVFLTGTNATTGQNDAISDFANGDVVKLGAAAAVQGTFINGANSAVISAANQTTIEAQANLVGAALSASTLAVGATRVANANEAVVFSYQGNQYVYMDEVNGTGGTASYDVGDAIVKISGVTSTTTFDAGTFLFAS